MKKYEEMIKILRELTGKTREQAFAEAIEKMTQEDKIRIFSYIVAGEDYNFAVIETISENYNLPRLKQILFRILQYRCSIGGWRSNQFTDMITEGKKKERTFWQAFKGLFRKKKDQVELEDKTLV